MKPRNSRTALKLGVSALTVAAFAAPIAIAQETADTSEDEVSRQETVVVTSNRREQSLQDAALAVSVLSGQELENPAIVQLTDIANRVPGLSVQQAGNDRNLVSLRGLAPRGFRVNSFPLVATYIDEIPISEPQTPNVGLYDLQRLEVLRGPQGTLYGESAMGGAIRYITNEPDPSGFSGRVDGVLSTTEEGGENYELNGVLNVPLAEDLAALRIVGTYEDFGGFVDNDFLNLEDIDGYERTGLRASLLFTPTSDLTIKLTGLTQGFEGGDSPVVFPNEVSSTTFPALPTIGETDGFRQLEGEIDQDLQSFNATINWDVGPGTLTSTTTQYTRESFRAFDETQTTVSLNGFLGGAAILQTGTLVTVDDELDVFTQELRYSGRAAERLDYTVGGYYRKRELDSVIDVSSAEFGAILSAVFSINYDGFIQNAVEGSEYEQYAVFAQGTYDITDQFRVTAGARYFEETVNGAAVLTNLAGVGQPNIVTEPVILEDTQDDILFRFGLEYDVSEDILLYTNFSQGFRPGGVNARFNPAVSDELSPRTFDPDFVDSYDVGIKSSWLDGFLTLNAEAFFIDYTDPQFVDRRDSQFTPVTNAGAAEIYGLELEAIAQFTSDFFIGGTASLNSSEFSENGLPDGAGGFVVNDGQAFPINREETYSLYTQYRQPLQSGADIVFDADLSYGSEALTSLVDPSNPFFFELPSFTVGNAALGYETDKYSAQLFVTNITDEFIELGGDNRGGVQRNRPRTVGVRLGASF